MQLDLVILETPLFKVGPLLSLPFILACTTGRGTK